MIGVGCRLPVELRHTLMDCFSESDASGKAGRSVRAGLGGLGRRTSTRTAVVVLEFSVRSGRGSTSVHVSSRPAELSGLGYFAGSGEHVGYEFWRERDRLMVLDSDPDVVAVSSQPFWLCWQDEEGRSVRDAPDYLVRRHELRTDLRSAPLSENTLVWATAGRR